MDPLPIESANYYLRLITKILDLDAAIEERQRANAIDNVVEIININLELIHEAYGSTTPSLKAERGAVPTPENKTTFQQCLRSLLNNPNTGMK